MTYDEIIHTLKTEGDPRAVEAWKRMGLKFENYYGFNLTRLKALSKKIKKDHGLALQLWDSNIHDARLLATYVADPKQCDEKLIDAWMKACKSIDLSDKLSENIIAKTPLATKKIEQWMDSRNELQRRSAYMLIYRRAGKAKDWTEEEAAQLLEKIESEIHDAPNWAKEAMNMALIAIGASSPAMRPQGLAVAKRIGKITIDYGDTSCKNPDAVEVLGKKG
jgi:3-methyladenine DNA glycosylase AlkD